MSSDCLLIQQASGAHAALLALAEPAHRATCDRYGIDYRPVYGIPFPDAHPFWQRVLLLQQAFREGYASAIWLDADCLIVGDADLRKGLPEKAFVGAVWHSADWETEVGPDLAAKCFDHFNTGALYCRKPSEEWDYLAAWLATPDEGHFWRDQFSFNTLAASRPGFVEAIGRQWNSTFPHVLAPNPIVSAWHGWGGVAERLLLMGDAALRHRPECLDGPTCRTLACLHAERGEHAGALPYLISAVAQEPLRSDTWRLLGAVYDFLGHFDESGEAYRRGRAISRTNPTLEWNSALWRLREGLFLEGWQGFQWGVASGARRARTLGPEWSGEPLTGKTLYVWSEQGAGDTFQYVRLLKAARERSGCRRLVLEVPESLLCLLSDFPDADSVVARPEDSSLAEDADAHVSLLTLPCALGLTLDAIPNACPYLRAPQERLEAWTSRLYAPGLKVGFCWFGSEGHRNDKSRSLQESDFALFAPLLQTEGVTVCSLMEGDAPDGEHPLADWADTAAVIGHLDLVITVDSAVAHLAGALGVPCWILLSASSDYRWLRRRSDSPWYPSVRLFRQKTLGDWSEVAQEVQAALALELTHPRILSRPDFYEEAVLRGATR